MNKPHLFKVEDWTTEEAGLLDEMKSRCLNKGQYIDEKAKDKFKMLCHLEDYGLQYYEQQKEIERLNNIIDEFEKWLQENIKISKAHGNQTAVNIFNMFLDKLKELKEGK